MNTLPWSIERDNLVRLGIGLGIGCALALVGWAAQNWAANQRDTAELVAQNTQRTLVLARENEALRQRYAPAFGVLKQRHMMGQENRLLLIEAMNTLRATPGVNRLGYELASRRLPTLPLPHQGKQLVALTSPLTVHFQVQRSSLPLLETQLSDAFALMLPQACHWQDSTQMVAGIEGECRYQWMTFDLRTQLAVPKSGVAAPPAPTGAAVGMPAAPTP